MGVKSGRVRSFVWRHSLGLTPWISLDELHCFRSIRLIDKGDGQPFGRPSSDGRCRFSMDLQSGDGGGGEPL